MSSTSNVRGAGTAGRYTGYRLFGAARRIARWICFGLLAVMPVLPAHGQQASGADGAGHRMVGGGINYAARPAVYSVIWIDSIARTVQLRAQDGRTSLVRVSEIVYDLSKLRPGDKIRVDFLVPDGTTSNVIAAYIWPEE